jgi:outer membrane protein TolC
MNVISKVSVCFFAFVVFCLNGKAQDNLLDGYIEEGLKNNLVLKQRNLSLDNALNALEQAKSFYKPSLDFQTLYTTAQGGREINVPVGDMLNPVYSTLNQMTGQNRFPQIKNEQINFLPKNYYDARVRLSVPIINTDIKNNAQIQEKQSQIKGKEVEIYERELIKEIKTTYYNYLSAQKAADIYRNAVFLAEEGKRTNEKLIAAGKGLPAYVMRSETEIAQATAQKTTAELQCKTLQRYFNALLNREADAAIETDTSIRPLPPIDKKAITAKNREELKSLDQAIALSQTLVRKNQQVFVPKLSGFADAGSQAEEMKFNDQSVYFMLGLQLTVPIFSGNRNKLKIQESRNEVEIIRLKRQSTEQQLDVSAEKAYNEVLAEKTNYETALKQLEMAGTYFRLITKGYASGVNTFIETVDARTQLTSAQIAASINYYRCLSAMAVLERETASYTLPKE